MKTYIILGIIVGAVTQMAVLQAQAQIQVQAQVTDKLQRTAGAAPAEATLSSLNPPLITGTVNPEGTSQTPTNAFTIAHPSDGRYQITFAPQVFGDVIPACIVMPLGAIVTSISEDENLCDIMIASLNGSPANTFFNFMAAPITGTLALPLVR